MVAWFGRSRKAIFALVGAGLTWGAAVIASPSGPVTAEEWLALGVAVATAVGVYGTVNDPVPPKLPLVSSVDPKPAVSSLPLADAAPLELAD